MKEKAIGTPFELDGKWYIAVEAHGQNACTFCAFDPLRENNPLAIHCAEMRCEPKKRDDCTHVRFKEVK